MALTLAEAAVLSTDDLQRGILETFVIESPLLDRVPFMPIEGNAYSYNKEATLPGVAFRGVNEAYTESTGTFVQASESLVILGGDADVDRFIVKTRGNLNDQRAAQDRAKVKAMAYKFQDHFINGDVAVEPKGFDGLKTRLTGAQVLDADASLTTLTDSAAMHGFLDNLDALMAQVPGLNSANGAIYTNSRVLSRVTSLLRRLGGAEFIKEDLSGRRTLTYNGVSILDIGQTPQGTDIIPADEGTAAGTSLYAVRFGQDENDQAVTGLTNGGVQVEDLGQLQERPAYRTRIEFYTGIATFGGKSAARLRGVQL